MKRKIDIIALCILIVGAINYGLIGIFDLNLIAWLFGGQNGAVSRIIYMIVAAAGFWCINLIMVQRRKRTAARVDLREGYHE